MSFKRTIHAVDTHAESRSQPALGVPEVPPLVPGLPLVPVPLLVPALPLAPEDAFPASGKMMTGGASGSEPVHAAVMATRVT